MSEGLPAGWEKGQIRGHCDAAEEAKKKVGRNWGVQKTILVKSSRTNLRNARNRHNPNPNPDRAQRGGKSTARKKIMSGTTQRARSRSGLSFDARGTTESTRPPLLVLAANDRGGKGSGCSSQWSQNTAASIGRKVRLVEEGFGLYLLNSTSSKRDQQSPSEHAYAVAGKRRHCRRKTGDKDETKLYCIANDKDLRVLPSRRRAGASNSAGLERE